MRLSLITLALAPVALLLLLTDRADPPAARAGVAAPEAALRPDRPSSEDRAVPLAPSTAPATAGSSERLPVALFELTVGVEVFGAPVSEGLAFDVTVEGPFGVDRDRRTLRLERGQENVIALADAGRYAVRAAAEGFCCETQWIQLDASAPLARVWLFAEAGREQRGRVLTQSGAPVTDAVVIATEGSATLPRETRTDAQGEFALTVPSEALDAPHGLLVLAAAYRPTEASLPPGGEPVDVVLSEGWTLRGVAVDEGERLIPGVRVVWSSSARQPERVRAWLEGQAAVTGAGGAFVLRGVAPGGVDLLATAPGLAAARTSVVPGEEGRTIRLEFVRSQRLAGVVRDAGGAPVSGVAVEVTPTDPAGEALRTMTDSAGRFEVTGLPAGEAVVAAEAKGFAPTGAAVRVPAPGPVELSLLAGASLTGMVLPDGSGIYSVSLIDPDEQLANWARFTQPEFRMEDLVPGEYLVRIARDGRPEEEVGAVILVAGETTVLPAAVGASGAQLTGTIAERFSGLPARGRVFLYLQPPDGRGASEQVASDTLASDGAFRLRGIAAGRYSLLVDPTDGGDERVEDIVLDGREQRDLGTLEVARGAIVQLSVRDREGAPLAGVSVSVSDGRTLFPRRTDARGELTLRELSPGTCSATIRVDGLPFTASGETQEGRVTELELDLGAFPDSPR